jgi:hypothetical protein
MQSSRIAVSAVFWIFRICCNVAVSLWMIATGRIARLTQLKQYRVKSNMAIKQVLSGEAKKDLLESATRWVSGQPAIVILLLGIITGGVYGVRWLAIDIVPMHLDKMNDSIRQLQAASDVKQLKLEEMHREERKIADDKYIKEREDFRKSLSENMDRVERMFIRKVSGDHPGWQLDPRNGSGPVLVQPSPDGDSKKNSG